MMAENEKINVQPKPPFAGDKCRLAKLDYMLIRVLFIVSLLSVVLTYQGIGLSWDEAFYYEPSLMAGDWLVSLLTGKFNMLSLLAIKTHWLEISELPSLVKTVQGLSILIFEPWLGPIVALRIPSALAFSLSLIFIYVLSFWAAGRTAAIASVFIYWLMPRVFGHAHIGATESITVFITLLVFYCFIKGLTSWRWSLLLALAFGLALDTKINCFFLPLVLIPWAHIYYRQKYVNNFLLMVFLSPLIMIIFWPLLWYNPVLGLLEYLSFHANHALVPVYYFGQKYNFGFGMTPWHYPFVITLLTIPVGSLIFIIIGAIRAAVTRSPLAILFLAQALVTLVIFALPLSLKYDGIRLFLPAFPFLALLGGLGVNAFMEYAKRASFAFTKTISRSLLALVVVLSIIVAPVLDIMSYHPHELSYFNTLIGGVNGAYKAGMETTYWGEGFNQPIIDYLNKTLPKKAKVKTLAMHAKVLLLLQDWGILREDIEIDESPPYDYHILQVRRGFFARTEWYIFNNLAPLKVFSHKDVPLIIVYKTSPAKE